MGIGYVYGGDTCSAGVCKFTFIVFRRGSLKVEAAPLAIFFDCEIYEKFFPFRFSNNNLQSNFF